MMADIVPQDRVLSVLPHFGHFLAALTFGRVVDHVRGQALVSTTTARKLLVYVCKSNHIAVSKTSLFHIRMQLQYTVRGRGLLLGRSFIHVPVGTPSILIEILRGFIKLFQIKY
jgi:hypothetical protein